MSPLVIALLLESVALVVALGILTLRAPPAPKNLSAAAGRPDMGGGAGAGTTPPEEADSARRTKELAEIKAQLAEMKEQLRRVKRERYEQKQAEKGSQALVKDREHTERSASQQLDVIRDELAHALGDVARLKGELELHRDRRAAPAHPRPHPGPASAAPSGSAPASGSTPAAAPHSTPAGEPHGLTADSDSIASSPAAAAASASVADVPSGPADTPARPTRELNPSEVARLERLEQRAAADRSRSQTLERDLKRYRSKAEMHSRLYVVVKGELDLSRDKYKALEKRLNRTLLERELMTRAIHQLEGESGKVASRTAPTAEELAASDARTEAAQRAEAAALEAAAGATAQAAQGAQAAQAQAAAEPDDTKAEA